MVVAGDVMTEEPFTFYLSLSAYKCLRAPAINHICTLNAIAHLVDLAFSYEVKSEFNNNYSIINSCHWGTRTPG